MNYHDSERMRGLLEQMGYLAVSSAEEADIVVINTCAVREKPERKLFAELGRLRKLKLRHPEVIVGVTGCTAPRDADIIRARAPFIDFLVGPRSLHRLPDMIHSAFAHAGRDVYTTEGFKPGGNETDAISLTDDPTPLTPVRRSSRISAWVDVQFGCNYACSYCAVPSARGREVSRSPEEIFAEIDELQRHGYKEIMLLGQTVNGYGRDFQYRESGIRCQVSVPDSIGNANETTVRYGDLTAGFVMSKGNRIDFTYLLEQINQRAPGMRVRFTSPHPQLFTDRLVNTIADLPTVCEHIHLPMQSADDDVLRRMKRGYTYAKFRSIVDKLHEKVPDIAITTDIIVGFPGETEEQFQRTLTAFKEIEFDQAFMFIYSPRRHTEAWHYKDEVLPDVQKLRLQELIDYANDSFNRKNSSQIGQIFEVLVEGPSEKNPQQLCGRTRTNKTVIFDGLKDLIGQLVNIRVDEGFLWGFKGDVVS